MAVATELLTLGGGSGGEGALTLPLSFLFLLLPVVEAAREGESRETLLEAGADAVLFWPFWRRGLLSEFGDAAARRRGLGTGDAEGLNAPSSEEEEREEEAPVLAEALRELYVWELLRFEVPEYMPGPRGSEADVDVDVGWLTAEVLLRAAVPPNLSIQS